MWYEGKSMITTSNYLPPPPSAAADLAAILALVRLLTDPAATEALVSELMKAVDAYTAAKVDAEKAIAASKETLASHAAQVAKERDDHGVALAAERRSFDREFADAKKRIQLFEDEAKRVLARAKEDSDAAAALRSDLEARLAKVREAAA
jgi:predicted  nucleic acid-binding Zn-ribbon protein